MLDVMVERHVFCNLLAFGKPLPRCLRRLRIPDQDECFAPRHGVHELQGLLPTSTLGRDRYDCPVTSARFYAAKLVCGIQFLHSRGVIHRDLNPENILVAETGHIKITDYGLALENMHGDQTATGFAGTMGYMAPEIMAEEEYNAGVDWFSLGVILNEMLTSECSYHPTLFDDSSSSAKDLIEQLLQEDPVQRLGVNDNIREHPFFQEIDWVSVEALRMAPPYIPVPTKPKPRFRAFKLDKIQAAEAALSITPEDQAVFRGFSFIT
ncbi:unnamed protein product [Ranitomeya imitator]|uniref:Protein kinase domain-containing protein n=1 Tax=Ranitomeya imitator TaxID=111125 RepID=A0ABN9LS01_9NEOB|nr:unnamed protein product [Ranitomeya imitator]